MEAVTQEGRRCTAKNRAGERCGKAPIKGGTVCVTHGGSAPQVRRKATLRLLELVDPAIGTLAREMVPADKSAERPRARSDERRVGKECVSPGRSRWWPTH